MNPYRIAQRVKRKVVPSGAKPRRILGGLNRGLRMELDLNHKSQLLVGSFENETRSYFREAAEGTKTFVDVGAADGYYTLFFLARSSAHTVLAFEPLASERDHIADNLALNRIDPKKRLHLYEESVGAENGPGMMSLDAVLEMIEPPCFVKLDIEGGEADALRGAPQLLDTDNVHWLIETHSAESEKECNAILREAGYKTEIIQNAEWRKYIPEGRHGPHNRWMYAARTVVNQE